MLSLLQQQGLDRQLQQSLLHGVLLDDGGSSSGSGGSSGGAGSGGGEAAPVPPGQQQQQPMTAAEGLERLRLFVQSAGRYGPDTGAFLGGKGWGRCVCALPHSGCCAISRHARRGA